MHKVSHVLSEATRQIASQYGELTPSADAVLEPPLPPDHEIGSWVKKGVTRLEKAAADQALLLTYAMYTHPEIEAHDHARRMNIIRNSGSVAMGYAKLPATHNQHPAGTVNDRSALQNIHAHPEVWLSYTSDDQKFDYTPFASGELHKGYLLGGGCPAVKLRVQVHENTDARRGGNNLFLLYWDDLVTEFDQVFDGPELSIVYQAALGIIQGPMPEAYNNNQ